MAEPRGSTDEEDAPLLHRDYDEPSGRGSKSLFSPSRPLTFFEKVLGAISVLLLILMSIFIGLFAGAEGMSKKERGKHGHGGGVEWKTEYVTATTTQMATTTIGPVPTGKPSKNVCLTPECVVLASSILQSLNTSVDPCDDFYQFATGGWSASHSIPADRGLYGAFHEVGDNNKKILLKVLDSIPAEQPKDDVSADQHNLAKLKTVYTGCMDIDHLNDVGRKPLIELTDYIVDIFGEFDVDSVESTFGLLPETDEWYGAWQDSYVLPEHLVDTANKVDSLKKAKHTTTMGVESGSSQASKASIITLETVDGLKEDNERKERLTKTLAWLHSRGVQGLINFEIEGDAGGEDSQVQSLWLYQAFGGLPSKEYYEEKPILDLYQSVVSGILADVAEHTSIRKDKQKEKRDFLFDLEESLESEEVGIEALLEDFQELVDDAEWPWPWPGSDKKGGSHGGEDKDDDRKPKYPLDERIDRLASKVVAFERELMRAGADPEYLSNPHYAYNPYPTEDLAKALPFLDIPTYLSSYSPRSFPANITVTHPPYLKAVSKIVDQTPDHVLSAYFVTRLAMTYASALGPKVTVRQHTRRLEEVLRGIKKGTEENRQDVCLGWVDEIVGFIAGREFVREAFSPEAKADGEHIIRSIVSVFHDKLPHISWMDKESAEAAQKKAEAIIPKIGYPLYPNTTDADSLSAYYSRLTIKEGDFFGNVLRSTLLDESRTWMGLGRQRNRDSWEMYPQTVNAYYSPPDGEIVFPAGILQPPFYSLAWPAHLRYGAFGAVAAHELTHAFDNTGAQYDERGRLRDWWSKKTVEGFNERAQCVARQYSKYYVYDGEGKKVYVNGNLTNGEDIADSGLAQAYAAWKKDLDATKGSSERLPGLDFSDEQLFFLAYARVWVQLTRPATAVSRVRTDPHSPPYWRAVGTLRNLDAFHQAFECKSGTGMNPPKKDQCELW